MVRQTNSDVVFNKYIKAKHLLERNKENIEMETLQTLDRDRNSVNTWIEMGTL